MKVHNLTTDQALAEEIATYSQISSTDTLLFKDMRWRLTTSSCVGTVTNVLLSEGLAVTVYDVATSQSVNFEAHQVLPRLVELGFVTAGVIESRIRGSRREFDGLAGQNYASLIEGDISVHVRIPANQRIQAVEIRFNPEALDNCCHHLGQPLPTHLRKPLAAASLKPYNYASILTPSMQSIVNQMLFCQMTDAPRRLFWESKCLELIDLYLAFTNNGRRATQVSLSPKDIARVCEARHILDMNLDDPPSLIELARLVNLNDFKLKLGFRQAFGTTAFAYLKEKRLQHAHHLLCDHHKSVTETALTVGYRNIGDFGIAFKRRFGVSPKYIRQP